MILKNILDGTLHADVTLITDDSATSGAHVLREILRSYNRRQCNVHYFAYDLSRTPFIENECDVKLYDVFSPNCRWFDYKGTSDATIDCVANSVLKDVGSNQEVLVIDSVSYMLHHTDISSLGRTLSKLSAARFKSGAPAFPVIMLLHDFNQDEKTHRQLEFMSNFILRVSKNDRPDKMTLKLGQRKHSGRLVTETYVCWLDAETKRFSYAQEKVDVVKSDVIDTNEMAELTTFKLTLEDNEIESRNKLVLPFMRRQEEKGKIFYEPDANDDWDDEDPDDDLEI